MTANKQGTKWSKWQDQIILTSPVLYGEEGCLMDKIDDKIENGWELVGKPTRWIGDYGVISWKAAVRYKFKKE